MIRNKHKGALSELRAIVWLLDQGYEAFRNVSQAGIAWALFLTLVFSFFVEMWTAIADQTEPPKRFGYQGYAHDH